MTIKILVGVHPTEIEIVVTPKMIAAGLSELKERNFRDDIPWILECVFRAMAYESPQLHPKV